MNCPRCGYAIDPSAEVSDLHAAAKDTIEHLQDGQGYGPEVLKPML